MADWAILFRMIVDRPGTTRDLAQRFGMRTDTMRRALATMRNHGLLYEAAMRGRYPVWSVYGPPLPRRSAQGGSFVVVEAVSTFCRIALTLMDQQSSRDETAEWSRISRKCLGPVLLQLHDRRLVFVEDWRRRIPSGGPPIPLFRFGIDRPDKKRPGAVRPSELRRMHKDVIERRHAAAELLFITAGRAWPAPTKRIP